jgi:hypothetical protein
MSTTKSYSTNNFDEVCRRSSTFARLLDSVEVSFNLKYLNGMRLGRESNYSMVHTYEEQYTQTWTYIHVRNGIQTRETYNVRG